MWYGAKLLVNAAAASGTLRADAYVEVRVAFGVDGLSVSHAGDVYADALRIDEWAPERGWRFALGARSGALRDDHFVSAMLPEGGAAFAAESVDVEVSRNGQDFSTSGLRFEYGAVREEPPQFGDHAGTAE